MRETQIATIRQLKGLARASGAVCIPIMDGAGKCLGSLEPVSASLIESAETIELLTNWRQKFMRYFLTQFDATPERTRAWLQTQVLQDDSRILFLIRTDTGQPVGNFGVCNIQADRAELDNLIRGERGGDARLVFFAELSLMDWLFQVLGANRICLHVFSDNVRTVSLHEAVGFARSLVFKLERGEAGSEVHYRVNRLAAPERGETGYCLMEITAESFYRQHKGHSFSDRRRPDTVES